MGVIDSDSGLTQDPDEFFPYAEYRDYQKTALYEAAYALFASNGIDTVVLNLPTGIGKSATNTALARMADSAFLTTPQKALRTQLEEDIDLNDHYSVLRARDDYTCSEAIARGTANDEYSCQDCPIYRDSDESCLDSPECTYWKEKELAMSAPIAVLTFSYLIVDGYLPIQTLDGLQVSFSDRDLLVVDECHKLEDQVASLHAGFAVSPYTLPDEVFNDVDRRIGELPSGEVTVVQDIERELQGVATRAKDFIDRNSARSQLGVEESQDVRGCSDFLWKYSWCLDEIDLGRDWVVDRAEIEYENAVRHSLQIKPVEVDRFLEGHIWRRAEKRVLSTATMPFSGRPEKWLRRLGLDPTTTRIIQHPMPFPVENRPIHLHTMVGKLSSGGYEEHRDAVVSQLERLADRHVGEKGLIHTASYERARDLYAEFEGNARLHRRHGEGDLSDQIWALSPCGHLE